MRAAFSNFQQETPWIFVDVMEIMGGEGRISQVLIRRHFRAARNFDAVVSVNLSEPDEEQEMMLDIRKQRPLVIVASINAVKAPGTHEENLEISRRLSRICARAALLQLQGGRALS